MSDEGGQAFPGTSIGPYDQPQSSEGMSLQEYYAGQVLAGIFANSQTLLAFKGDEDVATSLAMVAWKQAAAMIEVAEKMRTNAQG